MRSKKRIFLIIFLLIMLGIMVDLYASAYFLKTDSYTVEDACIVSAVRIVFVSDLHGSEFGKENSRLVKTISEKKPDVICIPGDLLNKSSEESYELALQTIQSLSEICPVFVSMGNHELEYSFSSVDTIKADFEDAGASIVDDNYYDLDINGNSIRIGGFFGYGAPDDNVDSTDTSTLFLRKFQDTDIYKICLCHMPLEWYLPNRSLDYWNCDLVLCGHTHGGQIRIPFVGGLYAPDIGLFPGREKGMYDSNDGTKHMILTTGLGNTDWVPRFNNIPEVVVVDILPEE